MRLLYTVLLVVVLLLSGYGSYTLIETKRELAGLNLFAEKIDSRLERAEKDIVSLTDTGYVEKPSLEDSVSTMLPSIVSIDDGDGMVRGTGFFISKDGYIATAKHVVQGLELEDIAVTDGSGAVNKGRVLLADGEGDIAVLKISGDNFPAVELGFFENLNIGEEVGIIGFTPGFKQPLVHKGNVSSIGKDENGADIFTVQSFVNRGNSGGPVFSLLTGRVIGVLSAKKTESADRSYIDLNQLPSGFNVGNLDPIRFSAQIYNDTLRVVEEVSQIGVGIVYSTDSLRGF